MNNQINKNKVQNNTLGLKNTDDLIRQILELLTIASCLQYLEQKEANYASSFDTVSIPNFNNTKH